MAQGAERRRNETIKKEQPQRGHLKIFFGYAVGVGKASAMIEAGREAACHGIDVVVGFLDVRGREDRTELSKGLEHLPECWMGQEDCREFDLDAAIARKPQLILLDDLSHTNAAGCRHAQRYQDVEELLKAGINVYTTANVQHLESLHDVVAAIIEVSERDRIPDSVFDNADQVELIDLEPQELIDRWTSGQIGKVKESPYALEKLTALREIALRRCADRMNLLSESARSAGRIEYQTDEHILVCLSSSPSNANIIRTAARMASAFRCTVTALFVKTPDFPAMSTEDLRRLQANMRLAQQLEAKIETVYGDDIPFQIAEFARLSGVTKIVIGRSAATKKGIFSKPTLTDRLIANAPQVDIHIIPDAGTASSAYHMKKARQTQTLHVFSRDILKSVAILVVTSAIGLLFDHLHFAEANIITVYVLGVLLTSVVTSNRIHSLISSVVSVLVFNFLFTEPMFTLHAYGQGYPVTFVIMFLAAFLTGTLATRLKNNARQSAQAAFRTKVLFDANQMLQQAKDRDEIFSATANQLTKLLKKNIVIYPVENETLGEPRIFPAVGSMNALDVSAGEQAVADWVLKNNKHAGATTQTLSDARCLYLAIRVNDSVYGVLGIAVGQAPMDGFENSILLSILGECALALENEKNAREKEEAAILARNEQLRANLLRAISHDLRTPLTSISGNASNLISNGDLFDAETKKQLYTDIYSDSMWLIDLVENLLSVTRLEQGQLNLHVSEDLLEDVITEALRHVNRKITEHEIRVESNDEFLLAKMDAKLIVQVVINLVDNAIKYTPKHSEILISTRRDGNMAVVSIADNGDGIPDEMKPRVFDMFYSGANRIADSRRSLGLGLSLCKSIIAAHGGTLSVSDNVPHGAVFTFTLPIGEVTLHES